MLDRIKFIINNYFDKRRKIFIGKYTYGNPKILSYGSTSRLYMGKYCSIAKNVTMILNADHRVDWISTFPFFAFKKDWKNVKYPPGFPHTKGDIVIGNDVWIGYGASILSGVKIGDGAIIGAFSLVTKDIEPYTIVGGNPAKPLKKRFDDKKVQALMRIKWWEWPKEKIRENIHLLCSNDIDSFIRIHDKNDKN